MTDKRHKGEVPSSPLPLPVREPAVVDNLSVPDDDNSSTHSLLDNNDDYNHSDSVCARTSYVLPVERWSGKRKRNSDSAGSKHSKSSKPTWVDGLGRSADEPQNTSDSKSHGDGSVCLGTPSPCKSTASSSAASSPVKLAEKRVPAAKAQPPSVSEPSPVSKRRSSQETSAGHNTHPPGDGSKRTRQSVVETGSKKHSESPTKTRSSATENNTRSAATKISSSSAGVSPTSVAVSSIVGMSPPATPVISEPQMTPSHRQSKQKVRSQRDPNSLPCKGNTFEFICDDFIRTAIFMSV